MSESFAFDDSGNHIGSHRSIVDYSRMLVVDEGSGYHSQVLDFAQLYPGVSIV